MDFKKLSERILLHKEIKELKEIRDLNGWRMSRTTPIPA